MAKKPDSLLSVSISVDCDIDINEWVEEVMPEIDSCITMALYELIEDEQRLLEEHIQKDVYEAYKPATYLRRGEDEASGIALIDLDKVADFIVDGRTLRIEYLPTGEYPDYPEMWTKEGNDLILTIETGQDLYDYPGIEGEIPPRPFWTNFTRDSITSPKLFYYLEDFLFSIGVELKAESDGMTLHTSREDGDFVI